MNNNVKLSWSDFQSDCNALAELIKVESNPAYSSLYGIPRGGSYVALQLSHLLNLPLVESPTKGTLVIDDVVDSGKTLKRYQDNDTAVLHFKGVKNLEWYPTYKAREVSGWIEYPWEAREMGAEDAVIRLLEFIGEDPKREGLLDTPKRVSKAWKDAWASGYGKDPKDVATAFTNPGIDQLIMIPKIDFYSHCEHHLAPFYGQIHIGYIPNGKVLGVSKFARIVDIFARRLQIQERLVQEVATAIVDIAKPQGVAVVGRAVHLCMRSRGVEKENSEMVTSVMLGKFREEPELRQEFLSLLK